LSGLTLQNVLTALAGQRAVESVNDAVAVDKQFVIEYWLGAAIWGPYP